MEHLIFMEVSTPKGEFMGHRKFAAIFSLFIFLLMLPFSFSASAENSGQNDPVRVLFIGNGLTYSNNMPLIFQGIARSKGKSVVVDYSTLETPSLGDLIGENGYRDALKGTNYSDHWDYIVLQADSALHRDMSSVQSVERFYYAVRILSAEIKQAGAKPLIYIPPLAQAGQPSENAASNQNQSDWYDTAIASETGAGVIPAGSAVTDAAVVFGFQPFEEDSLHPTVTDSYITACAFYTSIFNESPEGANHQALDQTDQKDQWQQIQSMTFQRVRNYYSLNSDQPCLQPESQSKGGGSATFELFEKAFNLSPEIAVGYAVLFSLLILSLILWINLLMQRRRRGNKRTLCLPISAAVLGTGSAALLIAAAVVSPVFQLQLSADAAGPHILYFLMKFGLYAGFIGMLLLFAYGFGVSIQGKTYDKLLWADFVIVTLFALGCAVPCFQKWIINNEIYYRTDAVLFAAGYGLALAAFVGTLWKRHKVNKNKTIKLRRQ